MSYEHLPIECPHCHHTLVGRPIPEQYRPFYHGKLYYYYHVIERAGDYQCPHCAKTWPVMKPHWSLTDIKREFEGRDTNRRLEEMSGIARVTYPVQIPLDIVQGKSGLWFVSCPVWRNLTATGQTRAEALDAVQTAINEFTNYRDTEGYPKWDPQGSGLPPAGGE